MKKNSVINKIVLLLSLCAFAGCKDLPETEGGPKLNVGYIEEFQKSAQIRFTVDDGRGSAGFTARVANPTTDRVSFSVEIDPALLEAYNQANNTSFSVLPAAVYDLQLLDDEGKVLTEGKKLDIALAPNEYGKKIKVAVKTMVTEEVGENGQKVGKPLSYYENYAIPVRMLNVEGGAQLQSTANSGIFFLNRKFTMPVMHLNGRLGLIYKQNTMPQAPGKSYEGDIKYPEWTCQYSFCLDRVNNNTGLMYPNLRTTSDSPLYMTLYGGSLTLFAAGGKVGLNQPAFKDFVFKEKKWYHMAISFKEEGGRPNLRLYINGQLAYQSVWPRKVDEWPIIFLGNGSFQGYVRELRFWRRALTEGEINETLWFANPKTEGLEVYLPLSTDKKGLIEGKENDWIDISEGNTHFKDVFTFPVEDEK